jgi:hypothetical protein
MNITNVKRSPKRLTTAYWSTLNIQAYGRDNLYPQRMLDLILNSPTGGGCCERYQTFIEGNGLNDTKFSEYVVNRAGDTVDDIFRLIAQDMAQFHGFSLHVNYNLACEVVELHHIPFQNCRLEEETENGSVIFINVHPDWTGHKTRKGNKILVDKKHIDKIYTFNPIKEVILSQIVESGGIDKYKGQILWFSMDGRFEYPKPIYDKVVTNLSTDEGLDNVKYRNTRNNFLMSGMLMHKKGVATGLDDNGDTSQDSTLDDVDFAQSLDAFQGDVNACSIIDVTYNSEEDKPDFVPFESTNFDDKFDSTEKSVTERIYSAFGQEPWYLIRTGKTGWSGTAVQEAYEYYNSYVAKERRAISRELKKIFDHWFEEVNPTGDYSVQPLVYVTNQSNESNGAHNKP